MNYTKTLTAVTLLLCSATANATLMMEISDGTNTTTISDNGIGDSASIDGAIVFIGSVGEWFFNVSTGSALASTEYVDSLDINTNNTSFIATGGTGTLTIKLTDTGYTHTHGNFISSVGGTTDGTVNFETWIGTSAFEESTLLYSSGDLQGDPLAFSATGSGSINTIDPYSMTLVATIEHTAGVNETTFDFSTRIPEPTSIALLGLGLLGLGFASRRKSTATA